MLKIGTSVFAFLLLVALIYVDWVAARATPHCFPTVAQLKDWRALVEPSTNAARLRMLAVARNELIAGEPIQSIQFDWHLNWVSEMDDFISQPSLIAGMFAVTNISASKAMHLRDFSREIPCFEIAGSFDVPITLEAQIATKLKPGMRIALVSSNSSLLLESALTNGQSFRVLSVDHDGTEPTSGIVVSVPSNQINIVTSLISSQWRPVIMPNQR